MPLLSLMPPSSSSKDDHLSIFLEYHFVHEEEEDHSPTTTDNVTGKDFLLFCCAKAIHPLLFNQSLAQSTGKVLTQSVEL